MLYKLSLFYELSWTEFHFYCKEKKQKQKTKTGKAIVLPLQMQESLSNQSHGCSHGTASPYGLKSSTHFHWVRSTAAKLSLELLVVANYAPKEEYTIIAYIQYNQDWIRKIQVQNDYIQEDSTSTKGYYGHLELTTLYRNFNFIEAFSR